LTGAHAGRKLRGRAPAEEGTAMHVGTGIVYQAQQGRSDRDVYRDELHLGDLAEPLGYESLWGVEHHFTDYTMCPDVLQHLTYFAGRTREIQLGSMVVVLPWHHPMRVAEQVAVLDHVSGGRAVLGIGRGLGRVEFEGFGVEQSDSRQIFVESAEMLLQGLERGFCEYDGKFVKQERREIRPRPFKSFRGRSYAAAVSPESMQIMARLGVGILIVPQKPWDHVVKELAEYRKVYQEVNGSEPPPPIVAGWVYIDEDAERAAEGAHLYIDNYYRSVIAHYELTDTHLQGMRGYEMYGALQNKMREQGGAQRMTDFFVGLHPWGTPEQVHAKILEIQALTGAEGFISLFSYGGMPYALAERNMRLFAKTVLPELKQHVPAAQQRIARAGVGSSAREDDFRLPV
jgi:alkanesulfonate monooxygenase SsuD/methylene tetrahydromethanopterin reductase-like flavin-dependent oxidoreductase (luciferase family)